MKALTKLFRVTCFFILMGYLSIGGTLFPMIGLVLFYPVLGYIYMISIIAFIAFSKPIMVFCTSWMIEDDDLTDRA